MKDFFSGALGIIISVVVLIGIIVGGAYFGLWYKSEFGVKHADLDRKIFKETKSYNEGMANDLANYKFEYETTKDEVEKQAIQRFIVDKYSDFDESKLQSYSLKQFLIQMRGGY